MAAKPRRNAARLGQKAITSRGRQILLARAAHAAARALPRPTRPAQRVGRGRAVRQRAGPAGGGDESDSGTAVSWILLGVTQGTLAVAMRVQGVMPFLGSLRVP